jgi:hypothetical protein
MRTTRARSHWIIEMADNVREKQNPKGELCSRNDRSIEDNHRQTISEEGNALTHEEIRLESARRIVPSECA